VKTPKATQAVLTVLALLLASLAGVKAESTLLLSWKYPDGSVPSVKDSSTNAINKSNLTILLGTFTSTNWSLINRANLTNSFVQYASGTFSETTATAFTISNPPTNAVVSYLVLTSGQSDLGIYYWADNFGNGSLLTIPGNDDVPFNASFATGQQLYDFDPEVSHLYAMRNAVGSVTATGVTLVSAGGSQLGFQDISFNTIASKTLGESFTLGAVATSALTVSYSSSNTNVATVSGSTVTIVGTGTVTITASQAGDGVTYAAATSVPQTFTTYAKTALALSSVGVPSFDGTSTTVTHNFVGNPSSKYKLEYTTDLSLSSWPSVSVETDSSGNCAVNLSTSGNYVNAWKSRMLFRAKNS
jgi:hypothetical protein